ncbi:MAG: ABC-2 family transporter protein [Pseudomonadota bacterium]
MISKVKRKMQGNIISKLMKAALGEQIAYRLDLSLDLLLVLLINGLRIAVVEAIMIHTSLLATWSKKEIEILYLIALVMSLFVDSFLKSVQHFIHEYHRGIITPQLLRPYSMTKLILLRWMKPAHALTALILMIPVFYYGIGGVTNISIDWMSLFWGIFSFVLGVITIVLFSVSLHLISVFAVRELPMDYIFFHLYRFSYWPIDIFPKAFQFFSIVMPVLVCSSVASAFLSKGSSPYLYLLVLSSIFSFVVFKIMTIKIRGRLSLIGG